MSAVRAFVFLAGMRWLREHGHEERFMQLVPPRMQKALETTAATEWVTLEDALACYGACDALELPVWEQVEIGRAVCAANNGVVVNTITRLVGGLGAGPWLAFKHLNKVWARSNRGGAIAVFQEGNQIARLEFWRVPLAASRFFVTSMRGAIAFGIEPFCKRLVVNEIAEQTSDDGFALRVTWSG